VGKIFSKYPLFQKNIDIKPSGLLKSESDKDERFRIEMTIKKVLLFAHRERIANLNLTDLFTQILTQKMKKTEGLIRPTEWSESDILNLEKAIKSMIDKNHIYHLLIKLKKSKEV
jgi:hypothetical protein